MNVAAESNMDISYFNTIKSELGLKSIDGVIGVTKKIFNSLQRNLPVGEVRSMLMKLPDYLQLLLHGEFEVTHQPITHDHLDQWVEAITREDELSTNRIFYSQLDVLKALVVTLNKLDKLCGILTFPGLKFSLVQEIKNASV